MAPPSRCVTEAAAPGGRGWGQAGGSSGPCWGLAETQELQQGAGTQAQGLGVDSLTPQATSFAGVGRGVEGGAEAISGRLRILTTGRATLDAGREARSPGSAGVGARPRACPPRFGRRAGSAPGLAGRAARGVPGAQGAGRGPARPGGDSHQTAGAFVAAGRACAGLGLLPGANYSPARARPARL